MLTSQNDFCYLFTCVFIIFVMLLFLWSYYFLCGSPGFDKDSTQNVYSLLNYSYFVCYTKGRGRYLINCVTIACVCVFVRFPSRLSKVSCKIGKGLNVIANDGDDDDDGIEREGVGKGRCLLGVLQKKEKRKGGKFLNQL